MVTRVRKMNKIKQEAKECTKSRPCANAIDLNTRGGGRSFLIYGIHFEVSIICSGPNEGELKQFHILVNFGSEGKEARAMAGKTSKKGQGNDHFSGIKVLPPFICPLLPDRHSWNHDYSCCKPSQGLFLATWCYRCE